VALAEVTAVISPPSQPVDTGSAERWSAVEHALGTSLPGDYKAFIDMFGTSYLGSFLYLFNPFSSDETLNLVAQSADLLDVMRSLQEEFPDEEIPYALFPEPSGLLPWGITDNGDVLYWLTAGDPDQWTVVINESRGPLIDEYAMSITTFLATFLTGQLESEVFPDDVPDPDALFAPVTS
jgi:hypothetical protein